MCAPTKYDCRRATDKMMMEGKEEEEKTTEQRNSGPLGCLFYWRLCDDTEYGTATAIHSPLLITIIRLHACSVTLLRTTYLRLQYDCHSAPFIFIDVPGNRSQNDISNRKIQYVCHRKMQ